MYSYMLSLISLVCFVKKLARGTYLRVERYVQNQDKYLIWNFFSKITVKCRTLNKWQCFKNSTNTSISGPLFTRLWALTTDFVLIQVNAGFNLIQALISLWSIPKFILPSLYESRLILLIYKKYGKSFVEIIPLQACFGMIISWNESLI